jgi:nucleoside-diphosphate-sugar epimerase
VLKAEPEGIVHQATALADARFGKNLDKTFASTNRLRTYGTDALLAGAKAVGARRFVAQSFASYRYAPVGGPAKTEDDPLDADPMPTARETNAAMAHLDKVVADAGGMALRYGGFYGADNDGLVPMVRRRFYPLIGNGNGITSWIHLEDAAAATVLALESDLSGIFNVVDDDPAPMREWLPALAAALGAKRPRRMPIWLARLIAGKGMVMMADECRGAINAKAKKELGWVLRYPTWREGFPATYATGPERSS